MKKSLSACLEGGVVAVVERQLNLQQSHIIELCRSLATHLITFVESNPFKEDHGMGIFEIHGGIDHPKGKFASALFVEGDIGRLNKIEIIVIPEIGFDDPPSADKLGTSRGSHGCTAKLSEPAVMEKTEAPSPFSTIHLD